MALYNVGLGAVVGGIGAIINKTKTEKTAHVFVKGFAKGALGGFLVYESKSLIRNIEKHQKLEYSWPAKIVNAAGTSIIEGAALNNRFLSTWHLHIGFNRLELKSSDTWKLRYKVMPVSFVYTSYAAFGNKFEWENTLRAGEIMFSNASMSDGGFNYANVFVYNSSLPYYKAIIAHEIIHTYQYYDFNFVNAFIHKPISRLEGNSDFLKRLEPILYYDLQNPVFRVFYNLEGTDNVNFHDNFFEYEAGLWSNTLQ
ncbi:hypothetical protein [Sediminicola luteus]|nr:hypothetical protein [Sediminicola luteus]